MNSLAQRVSSRMLSRLTLIVLGTTLTACGSQAEFTGGQSKRGSSDVVNPNNPGQGLPVADKFAAMNWFWSCQSSPDANKGKQVSNDRIDLYGEGTFTFEKDAVNDVPLTFKGELCRPEQMPRDIVFVIDVSGSMSQNDPVVQQTCGRLDAVRSVLQKYANEKTQFALVTFQSSRMAVSKNFGKNGDEMLAAAGSSDPLATICGAAGGTNYQDGLLAAETLLQGGRSGATKEVYFISDGAPSLNKTGEDVAARLRQNGITLSNVKSDVTIATIMLAGTDDSILSQKIASAGTDGKPLHARIAQANQLTDTLAKMANNSIVAASLSIRPIGTENWTVTDIMTVQKDFSFELPSQLLNPLTNPDGLEVKFSYREASGKEINNFGKIVFEQQ